MKIKNIEDLKKNINRSTFWTFCLIFCFSIAGLLFIHSRFREKQAIVRSQQIISTGMVFESGLSERLSIIASSAAFLDYLRSGEKTREHLYPEFLSQMSTLKEKSVVGMKIVDKYKRNIFTHGKETSYYVELNLCYLNQTLTKEFGVCEFNWVLYFSKKCLLSELIKINKSVIVCDQCKGVDLAFSGFFGSFPINASSGMNLNIEVPEENDQFFHIYLFIIFGSLVLSGFWAWLRLSSILNNYIANPIKNLADCLRDDDVLERNNNINEIQYLIEEINTWKLRVKKANEAEQTVRIGKIAAQLAHDVRSPLMSVDMVVKSIRNISDDSRKILNAAVGRISDITNNFLEQYRFKEKALQADLKDECLSALLKGIVEEKKAQHAYAEIVLIIDFEDKKAISKVSSADFKRVMSNLINNAVEAGDHNNLVKVGLSQSGHFNIISISDNGCGIAADLLPNIFSGISIGKENGNGLGLSHAKAKIEEWGGEIFVHSSVNKGTTITVTLPFYGYI